MFFSKKQYRVLTVFSDFGDSIVHGEINLNSFGFPINQ